MLTELCQELHNWFNNRDEIQFGAFAIDGGTLSLPFLVDGQYYRIVGSVFNDGVHQYGVDVLTDETFTGAIWPMKIPQAVLDLDAKITAWQEANKKVLDSPYQSESWNGYSYSLKSGGTNGGAITWQSNFASEMNRWRKI